MTSPNDQFWPGGARLAVTVSMQFEAGGQPISGARGPVSEPIAEGYPDLPQNSFYDYGIREGIPRMLRLFDKHDVKVTSIRVSARIVPDTWSASPNSSTRCGRSGRLAVIAPAKSLYPASAAAIEAGAVFVPLVLVRRAGKQPQPPGGDSARRLTADRLHRCTSRGKRRGIQPGARPRPGRTRRHLPSALDLLYRSSCGKCRSTATAAWGKPPITGKLRHDPTIPCHMRCGLPHGAATVTSSNNSRQSDQLAKVDDFEPASAVSL